MSTRWLAWVVACAGVSLSSVTAWAGGVAGAGPRGRVEAETAWVIWDATAGVEHLFLSSRVRVSSASAAYLASIGAAAGSGVAIEAGAIARDDAARAAVMAGFSALCPELPSPAGFAGRAPLLVPPEGAFEAACAGAGVACEAGVVAWAAAAGRAAKTLLLQPIEQGEDRSRVVDTGVVHLVMTTRRPVIPFAGPIEPEVADEAPPPPGPEHPVRVRLWADIGRETRDGRWERSIDAAVEKQSGALVACYEPALQGAPRLSGDVHVAVRVEPDGRVSEGEGARASKRALEPVAACFAKALSNETLPKSPFGAGVTIEVHATLRPPAAVPRVWRAMVLTSSDVIVRLGAVGERRGVPDARVVRQAELDEAEVAAAFSPVARRAVGLVERDKWRFVAIETGVDPHPAGDDVTVEPADLSRPIARPAPRLEPTTSGQGGPSASASTGAPRRRWWRGRRARRVAAAVVLGVMAVGAIALVRRQGRGATSA